MSCAAAVVLPAHLALAAGVLEGSSTKACAVVAFPTGAVTNVVLEAEVEDLLAAGAAELDVVPPLFLFRSGRYGELVESIHATAGLVHGAGRLLKVIVEAGLWAPEELARVARLAADGGADFVKTSTGVYGAPATAEQVRLLRSVLPSSVGVKASGGISSYERALEMVGAGATRIGASSAAKILAEAGL